MAILHTNDRILQYYNYFYKIILVFFRLFWIVFASIPKQKVDCPRNAISQSLSLKSCFYPQCLTNGDKKRRKKRKPETSLTTRMRNQNSTYPPSHRACPWRTTCRRSIAVWVWFGSCIPVRRSERSKILGHHFCRKKLLKWILAVKHGKAKGRERKRENR